MVSKVQGFKGSRLRSHPSTAFGMLIYEKSVNIIRPNPEFGTKLASIWEYEHFQREFRVFNAFFVLNPLAQT